MCRVRPLSGALARPDTRYLQDEAYLGDRGRKNVQEATHLIGQARFRLAEAIGQERAQELAREEVDAIRREFGPQDEDVTRAEAIRCQPFCTRPSFLRIRVLGSRFPTASSTRSRSCSSWCAS